MNIIKILAEKTLMPDLKIKAFLDSAPHRYKKYTIPKRNGGVREIAQPAKELKFMQRIISSELHKKLKIHENAYAYIENRDIKKNAFQHKDQAFLLKMDFCDFFHSIKPDDLNKCLIKNELEVNPENINYLRKLFFYKKTKKSALTLSIGAPSSPFLSNAIMFEFDTIVTKLCTENNITYTRYADDLTFSSNQKGILINFPTEIKIILQAMESPKLTINEAKTVFASKGCNRHITGVVINNDNNLSVGRKRKRYISSMIHKFTLKKLNSIETHRLKGFIFYINHIEPTFIESMISKYGLDVITSIKKYNGL